MKLLRGIGDWARSTAGGIWRLVALHARAWLAERRPTLLEVAAGRGSSRGRRRPRW
jgi:hypothetical protein